MPTPPPDAAPELPADPDTDVVEVRSGAPAAALGVALVTPANLAVVFVGGTLGTAAREALGLALSASGVPASGVPASGVPWAVLTANLAGALALGVLLEALAHRGPDRGMRRTVRLLVGTGFLGGFTTYSALASDTAQLFAAGDGWLASGYALGTVIVGAGATLAGILLGSRRRAGVPR